MKKLIIVPALVLAMATATATPAQANPAYYDEDPMFTVGNNPWAILIGLLLPAVQKVREAASR